MPQGFGRRHARSVMPSAPANAPKPPHIPNTTLPPDVGSRFHSAHLETDSGGIPLRFIISAGSFLLAPLDPVRDTLLRSGRLRSSGNRMANWMCVGTADHRAAGSAGQCLAQETRMSSLIRRPASSRQEPWRSGAIGRSHRPRDSSKASSCYPGWASEEPAAAVSPNERSKRRPRAR